MTSRLLLSFFRYRRDSLACLRQIAGSLARIEVQLGMLVRLQAEARVEREREREREKTPDTGGV